VNRAQRRQWLTALRSAHPDLDADSLAVAAWLARNVDERGEIEMTAEVLDRMALDTAAETRAVVGGRS